MVAPATSSPLLSVRVKGVDGAYTVEQLADLCRRSVGDLNRLDESVVAEYTAFGVLLLEIRRAIGNVRRYAEFVRSLRVHRKRADRAVNCAARFGTDRGLVDTGRLFELLHAYDPDRWPTLESVQFKSPSMRQVEAAIKHERSIERELSTDSGTRASLSEFDDTESGGDEWDQDDDVETDGEDVDEAFVDALPTEDLFDDGGGDELMRGRAVVARLEVAGSSPAPAIAVDSGVASSNTTVGEAMAVQSARAPVATATRAFSSKGPSVQMTLASLYEEAARTVDHLSSLIRSRSLSDVKCRRLLDSIEQILQDDE